MTEITEMTRDELLRADCFLLELDGVSRAGFVSCSGLEAATEVLEYREGGHQGPRLFRGGRRYGRLLLERGLVRDRELWNWFESGEPRDGAIALLDAAGREMLRWSFESAWPCAWKGPGLRADVSEVALERLEIVHEGLRWQMS